MKKVLKFIFALSMCIGMLLIPNSIAEVGEIQSRNLISDTIKFRG